MKSQALGFIAAAAAIASSATWNGNGTTEVIFVTQSQQCATASKPRPSGYGNFELPPLLGSNPRELVPMLDPAVDRSNLENLVPKTDGIPLYYTERYVVNDTYTASIEFRMKMPMVVLENSQYVDDLLWDGKLMKIVFTTREAYEVAATWPQSGFLLVTNDAEFNQPNERGLYLVRSWTGDADTNSIFLVVDATQWAAVAETMTIRYGTRRQISTTIDPTTTSSWTKSVASTSTLSLTIVDSTASEEPGTDSNVPETSMELITTSVDDQDAATASTMSASQTDSPLSTSLSTAPEIPDADPTNMSDDPSTASSELSLTTSASSESTSTDSPSTDDIPLESETTRESFSSDDTESEETTTTSTDFESSTTFLDPSTTDADVSTTTFDPSTTVLDPSTTSIDPSTTVLDESTTILDPSITITDATIVVDDTTTTTTTNPVDDLFSKMVADARYVTRRPPSSTIVLQQQGFFNGLPRGRWSCEMDRFCTECEVGDCTNGILDELEIRDGLPKRNEILDRTNDRLRRAYNENFDVGQGIFYNELLDPNYAQVPKIAPPKAKRESVDGARQPNDTALHRRGSLINSIIVPPPGIYPENFFAMLCPICAYLYTTTTPEIAQSAVERVLAGSAEQGSTPYLEADSQYQQQNFFSLVMDGEMVSNPVATVTCQNCGVRFERFDMFGFIVVDVRSGTVLEAMVDGSFTQSINLDFNIQTNGVHSAVRESGLADIGLPVSIGNIVTIIPDFHVSVGINYEVAQATDLDFSASLTFRQLRFRQDIANSPQPFINWADPEVQIRMPALKTPGLIKINPFLKMAIGLRMQAFGQQLNAVAKITQEYNIAVEEEISPHDGPRSDAAVGICPADAMRLTAMLTSVVRSNGHFGLDDWPLVDQKDYNLGTRCFSGPWQQECASTMPAVCESLKSADKSNVIDLANNCLAALSGKVVFKNIATAQSCVSTPDAATFYNGKDMYTCIASAVLCDCQNVLPAACTKLPEFWESVKNMPANFGDIMNCRDALPNFSNNIVLNDYDTCFDGGLSGWRGPEIRRCLEIRLAPQCTGYTCDNYPAPLPRCTITFTIRGIFGLYYSGGAGMAGIRLDQTANRILIPRIAQCQAINSCAAQVPFKYTTFQIYRLNSVDEWVCVFGVDVEESYDRGAPFTVPNQDVLGAWGFTVTGNDIHAYCNDFAGVEVIGK